MMRVRPVKLAAATLVLAGMAAQLLTGSSSSAQDGTTAPAPTKAVVKLANDTGNYFAAPAPTPRDTEVRAAVERGLAHIASIQQPDGSWLNNIGYKLGGGYGAYKVEEGYENKPHVGVTALCCMAFVANGSTTDRGTYSKNVAAGLKFLLRNMDSFGQIKAHGSRMYSHAFATLFLCEIFGMTGDLNVKREIHSAINFIIRNQISSGQAFGGWRYEPGQQDADTSITVCQVQALRAARNVGITVHKDVIEGARSYIVSNYHNAGDYAGCFGYQPADLDMEVMFTGRDRTSMALTAAGLVSLQSGGEYDTYRAASGIRVDFNDAVNQIIARRYDQGNAPNARRVCDFAFWYGHYYAAQAIRNYSHRKPELWKAWNEKNRTNFLSMQKKNGAWTDEVGGTDERYNAYATAMACLVLSVSNDYLPIFQN